MKSAFGRFCNADVTIGLVLLFFLALSTLIVGNMMNRETAAKIYDESIKNGGGTFDHDGNSVKSKGFAVAVEPSTYITVALDDPETAIEGILDTDRSYWNECIGTWIHNGQFHIDPVAIYYSPTIARSMAIILNQEAYYDLEKGETVYV